MDHISRDCDENARAYLDDIVIYNSSWEEHLQQLKEVLIHLQSAGLTINPAMCVFARSETEHLGFTIGNDDHTMEKSSQIKPQIHKVHATGSMSTFKCALHLHGLRSPCSRHSSLTEVCCRSHGQKKVLSREVLWLDETKTESWWNMFGGLKVRPLTPRKPYPLQACWR